MNEMQMKVMELVEEMKVEKSKEQRVAKYYKRHGQMIRRSYDDCVETERYRELFHGEGGIRNVRVFKCHRCGEMVDYFDLETWCCDFHKDDFLCSCCYEEAMGEEL